MEELRSTDILDREIEADAKKKAAKILANADAECERISGSVDENVKIETEKRKKYFEEKLKNLEKDGEASLPLEKQRFLVTYCAKEVASSINKYLSSLSEEKTLSLIEKMLKDSQSVIKGKKVKAEIYGLSKNAAEKMLKNILGGDLGTTSETEFEKTGETPALYNEVHKGVVLTTDDKKIKCSFTLDTKISEIEEKYSLELAQTLFGGRLPE